MLLKLNHTILLLLKARFTKKWKCTPVRLPRSRRTSLNKGLHQKRVPPQKQVQKTELQQTNKPCIDYLSQCASDIIFPSSFVHIIFHTNYIQQSYLWHSYNCYISNLVTIIDQSEFELLTLPQLSCLSHTIHNEKETQKLTLKRKKLNRFLVITLVCGKPSLLWSL